MVSTYVKVDTYDRASNRCRAGPGPGPQALIKVLWADRDVLCLFAKRLERGRFVWPQAVAGSVHLTPAQLSMLLEGIDWRRPERTWPPLHVM